MGKGVRAMDNQQIKEMLEKQLQLLSERSEQSISDSDLVEISKAMLNIAVDLWKINEHRRPY